MSAGYDLQHAACQHQDVLLQLLKPHLAGAARNGNLHLLALTAMLKGCACSGWLLPCDEGAASVCGSWNPLALMHVLYEVPY